MFQLAPIMAFQDQDRAGGRIGQGCEQA